MWKLYLYSSLTWDDVVNKGNKPHLQKMFQLQFTSGRVHTHKPRPRNSPESTVGVFEPI